MKLLEACRLILLLHVNTWHLRPGQIANSLQAYRDGLQIQAQVDTVSGLVKTHTSPSFLIAFSNELLGLCLSKHFPSVSMIGKRSLADVTT